MHPQDFESSFSLMVEVQIRDQDKHQDVVRSWAKE